MAHWLGCLLCVFLEVDIGEEVYPYHSLDTRGVRGSNIREDTLEKGLAIRCSNIWSLIILECGDNHSRRTHLYLRNGWVYLIFIILKTKKIFFNL
ncbi:hypothetical protein SAMN04488603_101577 [Paenibacillus sp. cl130]|nr:hypothetical protein SAMN04488603_101577 [Paenibacillus sp. cl130]